jgi:hypothetical protein
MDNDYIDIVEMKKQLNGDSENLSVQVPWAPWLQELDCKCIFKTLSSNWD